MERWARKRNQHCMLHRLTQFQVLLRKPSVHDFDKQIQKNKPRNCIPSVQSYPEYLQSMSPLKMILKPLQSTYLFPRNTRECSALSVILLIQSWMGICTWDGPPRKLRLTAVEGTETSLSPHSTYRTEVEAVNSFDQIPAIRVSAVIFAQRVRAQRGPSSECK